MIEKCRAARQGSFVFALIICCGVTFGFYTASYMRIPIVPLYAKTLGADTATVGFINSTFFLTAGCLSFLCGILSDRLGRKRVAAAGTIIVALSSFWLAVSHTPAQLMMIYFFFGVGLAAYGPTMMGYVADVSPLSHLGRSYGWYTTALYVGMSVGPAIGAWIADKKGYRDVFVASGIATLMLFFLLLFFLPVTASTAKSDLGSTVISARTRDVLTNRNLWACWLVTFGLCFSLGMFITFIPLHARHAAIPIASIGMIFLVQGTSNAVLRIPFGHWSDKTSNRRRLVIFGAVGTALAMVGFGTATSLWQFLAYAVTLGAGLALAFTSVGALIPLVVPPYSRGLAMGGYNTCIYFGIMLASAIMGTVIQKTSYRVAFSASSGVVILVILVFALLMNNRYDSQVTHTSHKTEDR